MSNFDTPFVDLIILELPSLQDDHVYSPGLYILAGPSGQETASPFRALEVYASYDDWVSYELVAVISRPAITGILTSELADGPQGIVNAGHSFEVFLFGNSIVAGSTDDEVLGPQKKNLAWLSTGEIISFVSVAGVGEHQFTCSRIYRGQGGTEDAIAAAPIGTRFALLEDEALVFLPLTGSNIGQDLKLRAIVAGVDLLTDGELSQTALTFQAVNVTPLNPVHLKVDRADSAAITLRWTRRTRLPCQAIGPQDTPLAEERERYEVLIYDGPAGDLLHTFTVEDVSFLDYTSASSGLGLPSPTSTLTFRVRQLGRWTAGALSAEKTG